MAKNCPKCAGSGQVSTVERAGQLIPVVCKNCGGDGQVSTIEEL